MPKTNSKLSGFHKLDLEEKIQKITDSSSFTAKDSEAWFSGIEISVASRLVENVVGTFSLPLGVATNFQIDGSDYIVPFVTEESSVVAAASNGAKRCRATGGFRSTVPSSMMVGQIQLSNVPDLDSATAKILQAKRDIIALCNSGSSTCVRLGGGCKDVQVRRVSSIKEGLKVYINGKVGIVGVSASRQVQSSSWAVTFADGSSEIYNSEELRKQCYLADDFLVVHIHVDCKDAMGANMVNTMAEKCSRLLETLSGGEAILRILSNLCPDRVFKAQATFTKRELSQRLNNIDEGEEIAKRIVKAYQFACVDPYRATTHNKGIMNAVSAVALATGQDTRAIESGAHAYAAKDGRYKPLTSYYVNEDGDLVGEIEIPLALGVVGGITKTHPQVKANLKLLGVKSSAQLGAIIASAGLAQNFAALRALTAEGIQHGHMRMHAANLALQQNVPEDKIDLVVRAALKSKMKINPSTMAMIARRVLFDTTEESESEITQDEEEGVPRMASL